MLGINIFFQYRGAAKCGDDWGGMFELRPVTYLVFATVENQESQNESSDDADGLNGQCRTPFIGQDGETDVAVAVDVQVDWNVFANEDHLG